MLSWFKTSFWSLLSIGSRTVSALAINKLVALQFGPNGITLLSHFQNLLAIATTIPNDGINLGIITYLGNKHPGDADYQRYLVAGILWQLLVFAGVISVFLIQEDFYLGPFLSEMPAKAWIAFFTVGLLLLLISIYLQAIILARRALPYYAGLVAFSSVGSALLIWYYLPDFSLSTLLLLYLVGQGLTAGIALVMIVSRGWLPRLSLAAINKLALRDIGKFILMALTLVICSKLVNFYVRHIMIARFDLYQTGLWQTAVKLSENYTMLYTSFLGIVYYPKLAALVHEEESFRKYVRTVFYRLVPLIAIGLGLFYALQHWFILLLFEERFLPAAELLDFQVIGDFFKMSAWILSFIITVQARTTFYIILQVIAAVLYLLLLFWLVGQFGLQGVPMAHCASFGLFFLFNVIHFRKIIF